MNEKEIIVCWHCEEGIKQVFAATNYEGESADFYFCGNDKCPRYGLASIIYKTKPMKEGEK